MIRWPRFLFWVARRLSGRPFSAAGNGEKAPSSPTPGDGSRSIRFRILVPLAVAISLLIGSFWAALYRQEQAEIEDLVAEDSRSVQKHFEHNAKDSLSVLKGRRVGWDPATVPRQPMGAPSTVEPRRPAWAPAGWPPFR